VLKDPFQGIGKPEPLKHLLAGVWSLRLTQGHRLVYLANQDHVAFLQARYHYQPRTSPSRRSPQRAG
jgi:toxin YoeB